jgi:folate-dependent phosphoribosylglycinamide formyltransferase PurN
MRIGLLTAGGELPLPERGELYEVACVVDCTASARPPRNLHEREEYDRETAELFSGAAVDYVISAGYPYVLTEPMLEAFRNRILVVHNGDLTDRDEFGRRRWVGPQPVLDALLAGVRATRTSLYIATADVGHGPLFIVGSRHAVPELVQDAATRADYDSVATYAHLHNRWMHRSWGELLVRAIEALTAGSIKIVGDTVWIDGVPGPCRLGEAPDVCENSADIQRGVPASCPFIQP